MHHECQPGGSSDERCDAARGIPGPESRTGLTRPAMTEAEFERRIGASAAGRRAGGPDRADRRRPAAEPSAPRPRPRRPGPPGRGAGPSRSKPRRVQRMFAIEEDLDKKLWLYAIHVGKDRSEVVNDLLRPIVASMVLYDSRDRRAPAPPSRPPTAARRRRGRLTGVGGGHLTGLVLDRRLRASPDAPKRRKPPKDRREGALNPGVRRATGMPGPASPGASPSRCPPPAARRDTGRQGRGVGVEADSAGASRGGRCVRRTPVIGSSPAPDREGPTGRIDAGTSRTLPSSTS